MFHGMTAIPDPTPLEDRRRGLRLTGSCRVRLTIDSLELEGSSDNISKEDVLVLTDEDLLVTVELMSDGVVKKVPGRLVRRQTHAQGGAGWAVEFLR